MLSSSKLAVYLIGFYVVFAIIPGLTSDFELVSPQAVHQATLSCTFFLAGLLFVFLLFPVNQILHSIPCTPTMTKGFKSVVVLLFVLTVYILVAGPTPPIIAAASSEDSFVAMQLREDAIKLNDDRLFVRLYCAARDTWAPIAFILGLGAIRFSRKQLKRIWPLTAISLALFIALWSGQKATLLNYIIAALVFLPNGVRSLLKHSIRLVPIVAICLIAVFALTYVRVFTAGLEDTASVSESIWQGLVYRMFVAPMEVSASYVDAVDKLRLLNPSDILLTVLGKLPPGVPTIESRISLEYFYREGLESGSANALAFAYAYVAGGFTGSFIGGVFVASCLSFALRLVRASHSTLSVVAFEALLIYILMDLVNGNFILYASQILLVAFCARVLGESMRISWLLKEDNRKRTGFTQLRTHP